MNYLGIAGWLSRWTGVEVLHEQILDQLAEYGVRYSRIENTLETTRSAFTTGETRDLYVDAGVQSADEFRQLLDQPRMKGMLFTKFERGVIAVVLARQLCHLAGAGDPAQLVQGNLAQYKVYIAAIEQKGKAR